MKTEEGKLKDKVKAFLKERGAYYHMPVPSGYGMQTLDFVGCYRGMFFGVETKAPGKKPTPRQEYTMNEMRKAGAWVVWGDNAPNLTALLATQFDYWAEDIE